MYIKHATLKFTISKCAHRSVIFTFKYLHNPFLLRTVPSSRGRIILTSAKTNTLIIRNSLLDEF